MYQFIIDRIPLPVPPSKIEVSTGSANKTYTLINEGEINILKATPLKEISFDFELPMTEQPYAQFSGVWTSAVILEYFKRLKDNKAHFQLIISNVLPNGSIGGFTNTAVSLENYTVTEDATNGLCYIVSAHFKEYKNQFGDSLLDQLIGNIGLAITLASGVTQMFKTSDKKRSTNTSPEPKTNVRKYVVKNGDTLWAIAKKFYDDGSKYTVIAKENDIKNPDLIYPKQELTIPIL